MAVGRELARFRLDLVRVQEVIWDKGGGTLTEEDCSVFSVQKEWTSSVKDIGDSHHQLRLQNLLGTGCHIYMMGWDGSVGIATLFGLDGAGIESLWGGGAIFHTRPDRPWGPPSLLYNGSFPGVNRPRRAFTTHPHTAPSFKKVQRYACILLLGFCGLFQGDLYLLPIYIYIHVCNVTHQF